VKCYMRGDNYFLVRARLLLAGLKYIVGTQFVQQGNQHYSPFSKGNILIIVPLLLILMIDAGYCDVIRIGVLANRGDQKCRLMWDPTAEYLSNKLPGYTFKIVPLPFEGISAAVKNEEVDFLLANPSIYVDLEVQYGISRIATLKSKYTKVYPWFGGVIFTRADNPNIFKLRDLINRKFVAVNETSLGGWEVALRELKKAGIEPHRDFAALFFSSNHEAAIHAVLDGKADAGTANTDVFADLLEDGVINLKDFRIIVPEWLNINKDDFPYPVSTRLYPNWPFSKLRGTREDMATKVAITLLGMNADNDATHAADYKGWSYPLNYQDVHELKKELKLGVYKDFNKTSMMMILHDHKGEAFSGLLIFLISLTASAVLAYLYRHSKLTEKALRQSEEKFSRAFRTVPAGLSISSLSDGRYIEVNDTFIRDRGYSREEIVGHRATELEMWVDPAKRVEMLRELQGSGKVLSNKEVKFSTKTGETRTMLWSAELLEFGGEKNIIAISQDITQLREMQRALRKSEEWYRSVIDYTYNWEYWIDDKGNFLYVSPSCKRITGYNPEDFMQDKELLYKIIHPDDMQLFRDHLHLISERGEVVPIDFRIIDAAGNEKWIGHVCQRVEGGNGEMGGRRVSNRDITDRKKIEKEREGLQVQLMQSQKMEAVGQLASGIAHDFNNIVHAIAGYTSLLYDKPNAEDTAREYLKEILELADRATEVTHSLLAFSRKQLINVKTLDLVDVFGRFGKLVPRIIGEDIDVNVELPVGRVVCMADSSQIEQALLNLVNNARDAMPGGGKLTLSVELVEMDNSFIKVYGFGNPGSYALISVSDTGVGMKKEIATRIFEPFYTTKEAGKGTGLGLAMVYGIIKQHEGYITVDSVPGQGTTFKLYLPAVQSDKEMPAKAVETLPHGGTEVILVAEDDDALLKLSEIILTQNGYEVITARDGQEAIDKFIEYKDRIQLVILDMVMPRKSGKEALHDMRRIYPEIKGVILSGYTADRINKDEVRDGHTNLLFKPISPKYLLKKVREIMDTPG
jgi:two-component system cell cycle sensor histidine kinase/response regulator CckA